MDNPPNQANKDQLTIKSTLTSFIDPYIATLPEGKKSIEEALKTIETSIMDLIGEDEPTTTGNKLTAETEGTYNSAEELQFTNYAYGRNDLRAEQRERLKELL